MLIFKLRRIAGLPPPSFSGTRLPRRSDNVTFQLHIREGEAPAEPGTKTRLDRSLALPSLILRANRELL
jgi:hypothetical protein